MTNSSEETESLIGRALDLVAGSSRKRWFIIMAVFGTASVMVLAYTLTHFFEVSGFAARIAFAFIGIAVLGLFDWAHPEINTIDALSHRYYEVQVGEDGEWESRHEPPNIAYSILLLGIAIIIAAALVAG